MMGKINNKDLLAPFHTISTTENSPPRGRTPKVTREWRGPPPEARYSHTWRAVWPGMVAGKPRWGGHWPVSRSGTGRVTRPDMGDRVLRAARRGGGRDVRPVPISFIIVIIRYDDNNPQEHIRTSESNS